MGKGLCCNLGTAGKAVPHMLLLGIEKDSLQVCGGNVDVRVHIYTKGIDTQGQELYPVSF